MTQQKEAADTPSHTPGTRKGEEMIEVAGKEAGRHEKGESGADRPTGTSTPENSTGINPEQEKPIHPDSPNMPPA